MLWSVIDDVSVCVHGARPPMSGEWTAWVEHFRAHVAQPHSVLVYTLGGGPSGLQRAELLAVMERAERLMPIFIVSSSSVARGIITAMNWFLAPERRPKTYPVTDLSRAFADMGLEPATCVRIRAAIDAHLAKLAPLQPVQRAG
jgi:hypothetical protein